MRRKAGVGRTRVSARGRAAKAPLPPSVPEPHERSLTALAAEAMEREPPEVVSSLTDDTLPAEGRDIAGGDADQSILENEEDGGADRPGRMTAAPDPNEVDEVGRAYGVQEEDSGPLRSSSEILDRRDHHRTELTPARKRRR
jgi:uncharacterized protein DUF6335